MRKMQQHQTMRRSQKLSQASYSIYDHVRTLQRNGSKFYEDQGFRKGTDYLGDPQFNQLPTKPHAQSGTSFDRNRTPKTKHSTTIHRSTNKSTAKFTRSPRKELASSQEPSMFVKEVGDVLSYKQQDIPRPKWKSVFDVERPPLPPIATNTALHDGSMSILNPEPSESEPHRSSSRTSTLNSVSLPPSRTGDRQSPGSPTRRPPSFRSGGYFVDSLGNLQESRTDFVKSSFDVKNDELYSLKKLAQQHMNKFSAIKNDYITWFKGRHERFLNAVKHTQAAMPQLVPDVISTMHHVRIVLEACRVLYERTRNRMYDYNEVAAYIQLFERTVNTRHETNARVYLPLCSYCSNVESLREPKVQQELNLINQQLTEELQEEFDFSNLYNERENLFAFRVGVFDHRYLGLVHYLPHVLRQAVKLCYLVRGVHLEKE